MAALLLEHGDEYLILFPESPADLSVLAALGESDVAVRNALYAR